MARSGCHNRCTAGNNWYPPARIRVPLAVDRAIVSWSLARNCGARNQGMGSMKKIAFGVLIALIAASPAAAAKKKKAKAPPAAGSVMTYDQAKQANENSFNFVKDSLPVYLPTAVKVIMYPPGNSKQ